MKGHILVENIQKYIKDAIQKYTKIG